MPTKGLPIDRQFLRVVVPRPIIYGLVWLDGEHRIGKMFHPQPESEKS